MKKKIAIMLALLMVMGMAACAKNSKGTTSAKDTTTESSSDDESGEPSSNENTIVARLDLDPQDLEAGKYGIVQPLEKGDVEVTGYDRTILADGEDWAVMASNAEVTMNFTYNSTAAKTLTLYIFPFSASYRWSKSDALMTLDVNVVEGQAQTTTILFTLPESVKGQEYAFVLMDEENAVVYFREWILTNKADTYID